MSKSFHFATCNDLEQFMISSRAPVLTSFWRLSTERCWQKYCEILILQKEREESQSRWPKRAQFRPTLRKIWVWSVLRRWIRKVFGRARTDLFLPLVLKILTLSGWRPNTTVSHPWRKCLPNYGMQSLFSATKNNSARTHWSLSQKENNRWRFEFPKTRKLFLHNYLVRF